MTADITITVPNHRPAPQGSKKRSRSGHIIDDSPRTTPWRNAVREAARKARNAAGGTEPLPTLDGPLSVEVTFTVRKSKSAPKRRVTWPTTRDSSDIDKLLRSTFDALTDAEVWEDDSRVVEVLARKVHPGEGLYALDAPGAVIRVWRLVPDETALLKAVAS